jgi:hypothetical protein
MLFIFGANPKISSAEISLGQAITIMTYVHKILKNIVALAQCLDLHGSNRRST